MSKLHGHLPPIKKGTVNPSPSRRPPLIEDTEWARQELRKDRLFQRKLFLRTTNFKIVSRAANGGPAGLLRMVLIFGEVEYSRLVLPAGVDWKSLMTKTPHGNLPVLWIDHNAYGEPNAIVRHLATQMGLLGRTESERLVVEAILSQVESIRDSDYIQKAYEEISEKKFDDNAEKLLEQVLPTNFQYWEEQIDKTVGPFFTASGISVADMAVFDFLFQHVDHLPISPVMQRFHSLKNMYRTLPKHPRLLTYFIRHSINPYKSAMQSQGSSWAPRS